MARITAICTSPAKGTAKHPVSVALFREDWGIEGDAHAGNWHRQVSLLSADEVDLFHAKGVQVEDGAFGENLLVRGLDVASLPVRSCLRCGDVVLEITQIGKECHHSCEIRKRVGDCIMPRKGVFARVLRGGEISVGMPIETAYKVGIVTLSDRSARGEREDISGQCIVQKLPEQFAPAYVKILPDEPELLKNTLIELCDEKQCDLILTTGGTGFSPRDITPEATLAVATRNAPGIAEAIRAESMKFTRQAMLSRGVSVIRGTTLIINLPGSPNAVQQSMDVFLQPILHGLDVLHHRVTDCAVL